MQPAPLYEQEEQRLSVLQSKNILGAKSDPRFDKLTVEASQKLKIPMSAVSVIDRDKEVYIGSCGLDAKSGPRNISFCGHALVDIEMLICQDTLKDKRFFDNPYVVGPPFIRFYAGMKLVDRDSGLPMAVFCVKDVKPRIFSPSELATFMELAEKAEDLINQQDRSNQLADQTDKSV